MEFLRTTATGYGEICPLGPAYLPAYAEGVRTGIKEVARHLIGLDPTVLLAVNDRMDAALRGHPYVKSALDMACWDILGKLTGQPVVTLLGGRYGDSFALYRAISQETSEEMVRKVALYRSEGYTKFQLKVGGDADTDIKRIHEVAEHLQKGDVLVARCEHRLDSTSGHPRRARSSGCGCVHRAAVC